MPDKFSATWVSHSSIAAFLQCPRSYYLKNVYKSPQTGRKMQIMTPALALGSAVHEVLESLSVIPTLERFRESLVQLFDQKWIKYQGKKGGFFSKDEEERAKLDGESMIRMVMEHPGPLQELAIKIKAEIPHYWLSEEEEIILCGKIDWLQYMPDTDAVHIIDFKTSKSPESDASLQLPIYHLLVHNTQHRVVEKASYWYLRLGETLTELELPDLDNSYEQVLQEAKKIKLARKLQHFKCPSGDDGCYACQPFEAILRKEAELVGVSDIGQDIYVLNTATETRDLIEQSELL